MAYHLRTLLLWMMVLQLDLVQMVSKLTISLIASSLQVMTMLISKMTTMNIPLISMLRHSKLLSHALTPL